MKHARHAIFTIIFLVAPLAALGQEPATPAPARPQPEYVQEKGFKGRVFQIQHRQPLQLYTTLVPLGSGFKGATMSYSDDLRTITVRDFPENIAAIEEAIRRLDVPEPQLPDVELRLYVLLASNEESAGSPYPAEIEIALKQLKSTLTYKSYSLLTPIYQRVSPSRRGHSGAGSVQITLPGMDRPMSGGYEYGWGSISVSPQAANPTIEMTNFMFSLTIPARAVARINSSITIRENEKVVVGTSSLQDRALVLIVTANVVK